MYKFKVGDRVRVKPWYGNSKEYKNIYIDKEHYDNMKGIDLTIKSITQYPDCVYQPKLCYTLNCNLYVSEDLLMRKEVKSNKPDWF